MQRYAHAEAIVRKSRGVSASVGRARWTVLV